MNQAHLIGKGRVAVILGISVKDVESRSRDGVLPIRGKGHYGQPLFDEVEIRTLVPKKDALWSTAEVAEMLGSTTNYVSSKVYDGGLVVSKRKGREVFFRHSDVIKLERYKNPFSPSRYKGKVAAKVADKPEEKLGETKAASPDSMASIMDSLSVVIEAEVSRRVAERVAEMLEKLKAL